MEDLLTIDSLGIRQWVNSPKDIVFLAGSRIEGFGNSRSDIDVYVIPDSDAGMPGGKGGALRETYYVDCQPLSRSWLMNLAIKVNSLGSENIDEVRLLDLRDLDWYYRTAAGRPIQNEDGFILLQESFRKDKACEVFHIRAGLRSAIALDKARKFSEEGRLDLAFLATREAVEWAVDSFLAAHREGFPSRKWRFEKLSRRFGEESPVYTRAWELKSLGNRDLGTFICDGIRFCEELGMARFPVRPSRVTLPFPQPGSAVFPVGGQWYLVHNKVYVYTIGEEEKYVWESIDGSTSLDGIAEKFAARFGKTSEFANQYVLSFSQMLAREGLIDIIE